MTLCLTWTPLGFVAAQLPVIEGGSATASGMLYYDHSTASDKRDRLYRYTVCPDSAGCILLDFNLVECMVQLGDSARDFIRVLDGAGPTAPLLGTLGKRSGSMVLQGQQSCLTVEFTRDAWSRHSLWTAYWRAKTKRECISPKGDANCGDVHDICGPRYHENFPHYGVNGPQALESVAGTCVDRQHNSSWYRFMAQRDGQLTFDILPDNGLDDFDWVLLRGDAQDPSACPDMAMVERKLACNFAAGRGPRGATGMGVRGEVAAAGAGDCPYSQSIEARKGDVFFLLIDDYSQHSAGFDIQFNDVVMACDNPHKDLLHIDHSERDLPPRVDPRTAFTQYTRILRIDLSAKANDALAAAVLPTDLFVEHPKHAKAIGQRLELSDYKGICQALIQGLKTSTIPAYAAHDFVSPVHYGDLLDMVARANGDSARTASRSWWTPAPSAFDNFCQVVELIVDERFDKTTGIARQDIRYIRLLWSDPDLKAPDYNVMVFRYEDVRNLLDKVVCSNHHNDVNSLSLRDVLEGRTYEGVMVGRAGKNIASKSQAQIEGNQHLELQDFLWEK
jgi:hypothetical protein